MTDDPGAEYRAKYRPPTPGFRVTDPDEEPLPPIEFEKPTRSSSLRARPVARPAPAPGGRPRDAREQIARALFDGFGFTIPLEIADVVLACPAVAEALDLRERVQEVMARCNEARTHAAAFTRSFEARAYDDAAEWLRRALDGA